MLPTKISPFPHPPSDPRFIVLKTNENMKAEHGAERVAVVDIDVHHGNGTQAFFRNDPSTFYASTHQVSTTPIICKRRF